MTFQVGDKVIYPNHGLGIVERVEEKTILGTTCGFFHLRIVSNDTTVLVPVANVDGVGLRKAITDEEVERLFGLLSDGKIDNHQNWKGRFKDNSDKMRTGSIYDMADVLKSLTFLSKSKSLSFREKRMLDRAKALIISEVSEVMREKALGSRGQGRSRARKVLHGQGAQPGPRHGARQGHQAGQGHGGRRGCRAASRRPRVVTICPSRLRARAGPSARAFLCTLVADARHRGRRAPLRCHLRRDTSLHRRRRAGWDRHRRSVSLEARDVSPRPRRRLAGR